MNLSSLLWWDFFLAIENLIVLYKLCVKFLDCLQQAHRCHAILGLALAIKADSHGFGDGVTMSHIVDMISISKYMAICSKCDGEIAGRDCQGFPNPQGLGVRACEGRVRVCQGFTY